MRIVMLMYRKLKFEADVNTEKLWRIRFEELTILGECASKVRYDNNEDIHIDVYAVLDGRRYRSMYIQAIVYILVCLLSPTD